MYLLDALKKFGNMSREQVPEITFEIAVIGQHGLDVNDAAQKYHLQSLPGNYSGLHLLCIMYVGFQKIAPDHSIGFDLSKEFAVAKSMYKEKQEIGRTGPC